ncbi:MAG: HAD-IIB family hydrolase [Treponema sp.]|jgi:HAD superfamily hydrolase (TIGR01484 family)|nr:HAD-IIB family hydrolase [Treponema sp.]
MGNETIKHFTKMDAGTAAGIRYILFDIDDTITNRGKLGAAAYQALWDLYNAGYYTIPVTGRPAGWCDAIIRQWPICAVIGENGAFAYYQKEEKICRLTHPSTASGDYRKRLDEIAQTALKEVPGSRVARDQFCRIYDLALDFNEDPPHLGLEAARRLKDVCVRLGAEAKISSIHVNAWFGSYDKVTMALLFMDEVLMEEAPKKTVLFFGDSPNDEPMFAYFPLSCGVANVRPFLSGMRRHPSFVTAGEGGEGFAEAAAHFLKLRG